jgi:phage-related protein
MKFKVTYYDIDTDSTVTKNCETISDYKTTDESFSFYPVDDPPKIYKAVVIDRPKISICQIPNGIRIVVEGYQYMKSGGYWKTKTIIENENSNS